MTNREPQRRYEQTEAGKATARRYRQSAKGKTAIRRYNQSEKARAAVCRYREDGRERFGRHGLTVEHAAILLVSQTEQCPVGQEPLTLATSQVDHDHDCCPGVWSCGRCVRGLVCPSCNVRIGFVERGEAQATPEIAAYLTRGTAV